MKPTVIDEITSLDTVRVQKVFGLFNSILVMELYSPIFKRLYLVVDHNPYTRTIHIQKKRPQGFKNKSQLINLLSKYAINQKLHFYKLDEQGQTIKAHFTSNGDDFCLILESTPKISIGFFRGSELMASLNKGGTPHFQSGQFHSEQLSTDLYQNIEQSLVHEKRLLDYHKKAIFERRVTLLQKVLTKKETLLKNIEQDFQKCHKNLALSNQAELLKRNLHLIKRGMKAIELMDYSTDSKEQVILDPRLGPQAFLEKMFNKIKRSKRGIAIITDRMAQVRNDIDDAHKALNSLRESGPSVVTWSDITEKHETKAKATPAKRLPYRTYLSSDNIKILVGKSAKDCDDLTLHYCRGNDWWFHARDSAGAHVVVKNNSDALPPKTLVEAAMLAQHFSKSHEGEILYTRAKYIRKPKGMAPGKVLITQEKTFEIMIDKKILQELLEREIF